MTQKDLGIELYISTSRVGQIEAKALQRICWHHPDKVKELQPFLYQVLSRGQDNFYARFFIKVFHLK